MKSFKQFVNESSGTAMRGDDVRVIDKKHKYYSKMGIVLNVSGKTYTVRFVDGNKIELDSNSVEVLDTSN